MNAALLFGMLLWRGHWQVDIPLLTRIPRLLLAAALMAGFVHYALTWLTFELSSASSIFVRAGTIMALVFAAMLVYFVLAFVFRRSRYRHGQASHPQARQKNVETEAG